MEFVYLIVGVIVGGLLGYSDRKETDFLAAHK
jgi:hypothetical protein